MTDLGWIDVALRSARPRVVAALLRGFRDLDLAEEAFQEACLRALRVWPEKGPPRDPAAWLIFVGKNSAVDAARKRARLTELTDDVAAEEVDLAEALDQGDFRDDILRLLFICCHPELPATQQIALALRIVCGLTVAEVARAFMVSETAMEQRVTRAKGKVAAAEVPFEAPDVDARAQRLSTVASMIYLVFNEGYSATGGEAHKRAQLCDEAIRLGRLLLRLFAGEPEIMGLLALMLLQHARSAARLDAHGAIVLLDDQDRSLWDRPRIDEGLALLEKALRHRRRGPYQVQAAIAAMHARARRPEDTDWTEIEVLYAVLESVMPSPVVRLNRAVAAAKARGAEAALEIVDNLHGALDGYFYYHGVRGALLAELGRRDEARKHFERAIGMASSLAEAAHIRLQLDRLTRVG